MSTVKVNNVQLGQSLTPTDNFTISVPAVPDGTFKIARGNVGATTQDIFSVGVDGSVEFGPTTLVLNTTSTQTLTNKTIAFGSNTLTDVASINTSQTLTNKTIAFGSNTLTDVASINTSQTLTNKTLSSPILSGDATGNDGLLTRVMLQDTGWDFYDSGTTNDIDYVNGSAQRWAPNTGSQTLTITNWPPAGNLGELLIEGINLGAAAITWPTINWVKSDGTTTTTFSSNGVSLQASGTDWVFLWTRDAGTTIYGKVVR